MIFTTISDDGTPMYEGHVFQQRFSSETNVGYGMARYLHQHACRSEISLHSVRLLLFT